MAELGTIPFTNLESGAVSPSTGSDLTRGIAQTLDVAGQIRVNDVLGDLREDAEQLILESKRDLLSSEEEDSFVGPPELEGEAAEVQMQTRRLVEMREQGNGSQKALAELKLKQLLNKYQGTYPALAAQLQAQLGQVVTGSAALDEIGLLDQINASNTKAAEAALKDMTDIAYKAVKDGGFGINPRHRPGSAEFARQYAQASEVRRISELKELNVQLAAVSADMSAEERLDRVHALLTGTGNSVNRAIDEFASELNRYRQEVGKSNPDLQYLQTFKDNIRPAMIETLGIKRADFLNGFDQLFPIGERGTPSYERAVAERDDVLAYIDSYMEAFSGEDPGAMDVALAAERIRGMEWRRTQPEFQRFMQMWDPSGEGVKDTFELILTNDQTGLGVMLGQNLATELQGFDLVGNLFGSVPASERPSAAIADTFVYGGQGKIYDHTGPDQILRTLRSNWAHQEGFYGKGNVSESEDIKTALGHLEMYRRSTHRVVQTEDPHQAAVFMDLATNGLLAMDAIGNPNEQQLRLTEAMLSDPQTFNASLVGGNTTNANRRIAFGTAADEFLANQGPLARQQALQQRFERASYNGLPLRNFLRFKFTDTEGDVVDSKALFTFEVDKDYVRQSFPGGQAPDGLVNSTIRDITAKAIPLVNEVNTHIRAAAHIDAWKQPTVTEDMVDYPDAAETLGWVNYFFRIDDAQ